MKPLENCSILIVDDTRVNLEILVEILGDHYEVAVATEGRSALRMLETYVFDLILLDVMMPEIDGFEVMRQIKANPKTASISVIFITALSEIDHKTRAFNLGAVDYIVKPFNMDEVLSRVKTHLSLRLAQMALENQNAKLERKVRERTEEINLIQQATMMSFATLAEYRDNETGAHIRRIKEYSKTIARALQRHPKYRDYITETYIDLLGDSSPLHDIGKVGIPDAILLKNGKLTEAEYAIMKNHTTYGKAAIESVENDLIQLPFLNMAKEIAQSHHEKFDGTGYPQGLSGEKIPISARIVAVADVFDGLSSRRVYKPPFPLNETVGIIIEGKGTHFDPDVVDAFLACIEEIRQVGIAQADSDEERDALNMSLF
ncbi:HD domain-containing phosphohydrolase [Fusibacter tunisiensis]|uniref:Stage 0 sporulation protein A homolog n=1 Tax=Fusibacter tunisiensis TaxID=1008308 RepID=A0ABS2MSN0_9FIRM|nr:HD domain-containing phosphohydrolase [Fusibacter tunisiensis]MBM7562434.1 putative two-component system response regulator [Fusibacter tunisiensis]